MKGSRVNLNVTVYCSPLIKIGTQMRDEGKALSTGWGAQLSDRIARSREAFPKYPWGH